MRIDITCMYDDNDNMYIMWWYRQITLFYSEDAGRRVNMTQSLWTEGLQPLKREQGARTLKRGYFCCTDMVWVCQVWHIPENRNVTLQIMLQTSPTTDSPPSTLKCWKHTTDSDVARGFYPRHTIWPRITKMK